MNDAPLFNDADLRVFLTARAEAVASQAGTPDAMAERVAVSLALVTPRSSRAVLRRVAVVAAAALLIVLALAIGSGTPPEPSPTPTPAPPATLVAATPVQIDATAIEVTSDSVWVADQTGRLLELDPASGAVVRELQLEGVASDLLVTADSVWAASATSDLTRVDLGSLAPTTIVDARGVALSLGPDVVWLGADDEVIRIDPATNAVDLRVPVAGRSAELGIVTFDNSVWVGTFTQFIRLDATSGAVTGTIEGDASQVAVSAGSVWAIRGTELLRIDPQSTSVLAFIPGLPGNQGLVATEPRIWVGGPGGGGSFGVVVGVSTTSERIDARAEMPASVRALGVGVGGIWVASDPGGTIYRFVLP